MGEIADAYIWAEMNGVDLDDNPEGRVEYYHDKECEEYEQEINDLKNKVKRYKKVISKQKELLKKCKELIEKDCKGSSELADVLIDRISEVTR